MSLKTEPILTTTQVNNRLLEFLRLFMQNYHEMGAYQREIMFDVIQHLVKHPSPIESDYFNKKKGKDEK